MISSATVQSAIVLTNRRMKTERDVITFVPVCSSVAGMHLHHLEGTNQAQAQTSCVLAQYDSAASGGTRCPQRVGTQMWRCRLTSFIRAISAQVSSCALQKTFYGRQLMHSQSINRRVFVCLVGFCCLMRECK